MRILITPVMNMFIIIVSPKQMKETRNSILLTENKAYVWHYGNDNQA